MQNEINIMLFVNSNCDNCKLMQHELIDNPPNGNVTIVHVKRDEHGGYPYRNRVKTFPTTVVYTYPYPYEIAWFEGFVSTDIINESIESFKLKFTIK